MHPRQNYYIFTYPTVIFNYHRSFTIQFSFIWWNIYLFHTHISMRMIRNKYIASKQNIVSYFYFINCSNMTFRVYFYLVSNFNLWSELLFSIIFPCL